MNRISIHLRSVFLFFLILTAGVFLAHCTRHPTAHLLVFFCLFLYAFLFEYPFSELLSLFKASDQFLTIQDNYEKSPTTL